MFFFLIEIVLCSLFSVLEDFTRANILGQLAFDQVETISSLVSSPFSKLLLTHGPDGSIDHDSAVNTVCFFIFFLS